jgi:RimJ/RimL family protein N-acetyltransferase
MNFQLQPTLQNDYVILEPLKESDFELLYKIASDPLVWEQHPNKNRYKREVFQTYFEGAIQSKGAFLVRDVQTKDVIGCTRFYDYNERDKSILIGYTFLGRNCWGGKYNPSMKQLMLETCLYFCR